MTVDCAPSVSVALADSFMAEDGEQIDHIIRGISTLVVVVFIFFEKKLTPQNWGRFLPILTRLHIF